MDIMKKNTIRVFVPVHRKSPQDPGVRLIHVRASASEISTGRHYGIARRMAAEFDLDLDIERRTCFDEVDERGRRLIEMIGLTLADRLAPSPSHLTFHQHPAQ
jgi:hypothetical protein